MQRTLIPWWRWLVLLGFLGPGCVEQTPSGDTGTSSSSSSSDGGSTAAPPMLDEPYGACAGPMASTECAQAGVEVAECIDREDAQGIPHSVCAVSCMEDADCPPVGGNTAPTCAGSDDAMLGRCVVTCSLEGVNSCPQGTFCVGGDPPSCMWPSSNPGHPDAQSFCDTACGPCGATLLLPWSGDCTAECVGDLADCSPSEQEEVFACTGGEACPMGGAIVAECLMPIACVMGTR